MSRLITHISGKNRQEIAILYIHFKNLSYSKSNRWKKKGVPILLSNEPSTEAGSRPENDNSINQTVFKSCYHINVNSRWRCFKTSNWFSLLTIPNCQSRDDIARRWRQAPGIYHTRYAETDKGWYKLGLIIHYQKRQSLTASTRPSPRISYTKIQNDNK